MSRPCAIRRVQTSAVAIAALREGISGTPVSSVIKRRLQQRRPRLDSTRLWAVRSERRGVLVPRGWPTISIAQLNHSNSETRSQSCCRLLATPRGRVGGENKKRNLSHPVKCTRQRDRGALNCTYSRLLLLTWC